MAEVQPRSVPRRAVKIALGCAALLIGLLALGLLPGWLALRRAEADRAALRPGMHLAEVFAAARGWKWAWGRLPDPNDPEGMPQVRIQIFNGTRPSVSGDAEDSIESWEHLLQLVQDPDQPYRACTRWSFVYLGSPTPAKAAFGITQAEGKVTQISPVSAFD